MPLWKYSRLTAPIIIGFFIGVSFTVFLLEWRDNCSVQLMQTSKIYTDIKSAVSSSQKSGQNDRIPKIMALWERSRYLNQEKKNRLKDDELLLMPRPPHLEDCKTRAELNKKLDSRGKDGTRPRWTEWKGRLGQEYGQSVPVHDNTEEMLYAENSISQGPNPPWIEGADGDNFPMTRRAQRDLWLHQHPRNCTKEGLKFLYTDWTSLERLGLGAQLVYVSGLFAAAMNENRILVTRYFNRADHKGCKGKNKGRWSCYFLDETSEDCRQHASRLAAIASSWKDGTITSHKNYPEQTIWFGPAPELWGKPWEWMQPTIQINGSLLFRHEAEDRRWWRAQAMRYLMRYPSESLCNLMNVARHKAFGAKAAALVADTFSKEYNKKIYSMPIQHIVWDDNKLWLPRPLISMHVRQGDKAIEMEIFDFKAYMDLAKTLRSHFPHVQDIWLSTEMQNVVDESWAYRDWNFYFTNITRQIGNLAMSGYESSIGKEQSSNNAFVNFLMANEADYFIGALGSTWCVLIDGMRSTSGKIMAGYLSVNKDRFW